MKQIKQKCAFRNEFIFLEDFIYPIIIFNLWIETIEFSTQFKNSCFTIFAAFESISYSDPISLFSSTPSKVLTVSC